MANITFKLCTYAFSKHFYPRYTFCKFIYKPLVKSVICLLIRFFLLFVLFKSIMLTNAALLSDQAYCVNRIFVKYNIIAAGLI